jgi:hypothetical protein
MRFNPVRIERGRALWLRKVRQDGDERLPQS